MSKATSEIIIDMLTRESQQARNRYLFDYTLCSPSEGFAQLDTTDDGTYYGHWVHPVHRLFVAYVEGDFSVTPYQTDRDFAQALRDWVEWAQLHGTWRGIDPGQNERLKGHFLRLGLDDLLSDIYPVMQASGT